MVTIEDFINKHNIPELKLNRFTLSYIRQQYNKAKRKKVSDETIRVVTESGSPDDFEHYWTISKAKNFDDLYEEIATTREYAKKRLKKWRNADQAYDEWMRQGFQTELNKDIEEFVKYKSKEDELKNVLSEIQGEKKELNLSSKDMSRTVNHLVKYINRSNPSPSKLRSHFSSWAGKEFGRSKLYRKAGSKTNRLRILESLQDSGLVEKFEPGKSVKTGNLVK